MGVKSEHQWIQQTAFEPLGQAKTLSYVLDIIDKFNTTANSSQIAAAIVFDLDSTLFEVRHRTLRIVKEFARSKVAREFAPEYLDWWRGRSPWQMHYTLEESARAGGFPLLEVGGQEFLAQLTHYWWDRFFTSEYVLHDVPTLGARDYVSRVVDLGAHVIYLTGRDQPNMETGTRLMLEHCGFPMREERATLVMKPSFHEDDERFKGEYLANLCKQRKVLALFDNEPANFAAFAKYCPEAELVFRHSTCSTKPASRVKRVYKIDDFQF